MTPHKSHKELFDLSITVDEVDGQGIYFFWDDGVCVYVGKSIHMVNRVTTHKYGIPRHIGLDGKLVLPGQKGRKKGQTWVDHKRPKKRVFKIFDRVTLLRYAGTHKSLIELENYYIKKFNPKYNGNTSGENK
jgi:excinuclease UvrABC nuclease subunit